MTEPNEQRLPAGTPVSGLTGVIEWAIVAMRAIPYWLVAFLGRFSIAAVFWKSGQTKVENFAIDLVSGTFHLGVPRLSDSAVLLFKEEYRLPLLSPELGATLAALAEHIFPVLLLFGFATRFSALGLLVMTAVIEIFVYPDAYPTHGTWAAILLFLMVYGPGRLSLDHLFFGRK
jgi:putative oxidoreductase